MSRNTSANGRPAAQASRTAETAASAPLQYSVSKRLASRGCTAATAGAPPLRNSRVRSSSISARAVLALGGSSTCR